MTAAPGLGGRRARVVDLTAGPLARGIVLFALPLLGAALIQLLYSTVDLMFVGHVLGTGAAAAVGASGLVVTCLVGIFTGLGTGTGVLIAGHFGAGRHNEVERVMHTALTFGLAGGLVLIPVMIALAPALMARLGTPPEIVPSAVVYLRIYLLGLVSVVLFNMGSGVLRALGDSLTPMRCQLVGGVVNVLVDALFIVVLRWGIGGAAVATLLSQTLAAGLVLLALRRLDERYRLRLSRFHLHPVTLREILAIGLPAGAQALVITLSNVAVQYRINALGIWDIAAFTVWFRVENFMYMPIMALGQAASTCVAQNLGAEDRARTRRAIRLCCLIGVVVTVVLAAALLLASRPILGMFTADPDVIALATGIARIIGPCYMLFALMEIVSSSIRGAGRALPPMIIIVSALCAMRVVLLMALPKVFGTVSRVALLYPLSWMVTDALLLGYLLARRAVLWGGPTGRAPGAHGPC
ncbi:MATE family efflux transporter [Propionibacterium acidifaciens]|mgnify:FL=1|uniref:MATE family efflux transporter n=1 Tax=Propionibacterium acidifaciens TaxID=556499 RepID=UPI0028DBD3AC|nr:MATE family efflux transporter [Propionibacterium acidifaciens]